MYVCACVINAYAKLKEDDGVGASQNVWEMCVGGALFIH